MQARVVVVEDDVLLADVISNALRDEGYVVDICDGVAPAVDHITRTQPALVLTDAYLRDGTAKELVQQLDASGDQRAAVVVMSGADPHTNPACDVEHTQGFLKKPFDIDELLTLVMQFAGR